MANHMRTTFGTPLPKMPSTKYDGPGYSGPPLGPEGGSARGMLAGNPYSVAEQMLPQSSSMRGLDGMNRTSAPPGPNAYDQGGSSKPSVNTQPFNNERLAQQNMMVRQSDALSQAQADGVQGFRKQALLDANDEYKSASFAEARKAEVMEVLGSPATQYMSQMDDIEGKAVRNSMAVSKAMSVGANPDLIQNQMGM